VSQTACGFPLFSRRISKSPKQSKVIFISQHFGTGVLLATAFVHLLPTAFISLTDPCLPYVFSSGYKPLAGLIAMAFALMVVALESYLTARGAGHSHSHQVWVDDDDDDTAHDGGTDVMLQSRADGFSARRQSGHRPADMALEDLETQGLVAGASPLPGSTPTHQPNEGEAAFKANGGAGPSDNGDGDGESLDLDLDLDELDPVGHAPPPNRVKRSSTSSIPHIPDREEQKRLLLQCLLLEAGILFHSVFIGMALSVATGPTFAVFLIAIALHQSFEGLALGGRIAAIHFPKSSPRPWLMVLAYGTTTPIGQAIGLLLVYDPMSEAGLLMVGVMNAISSGLLLYAGLVQLLAEDFLTEKSYKTLRGRKRVHAFLAVVAGASLMAAVGALA
jgi:hypothetical protein